MKKALLLMLTLLTLGFVAAPVSAQTVWDGTADITWYDASQTSFDISTPEQLAGVAQLVNSGTSFNGMTLNLVADIWLNSTGDSTNNWVPIGGSATATSEAQSSGNSFRGVFNGHGHTIYNMYCEKINYFHAGLFGCIQNPCTIDSLVLINPTVKSCGMMGAIAGMTRSGGQIYIRYCLVINANIVGTPGNTGPSASHNNIGGIVGANYPNTSGTYIQNCGVTGNISGYYIGGIGGNAQYDYLTNCYFAGTLTPYNTNYGGMTAHDGTRTNCYSYAVVNGSQSQSSASNDGTSVTQAEMQDPQMIVNLGDAFKMDNGINDGYPIMSYMAGVDPIEAEICQGESITITAFGFDSYLWSNGATSDAITVSPNTTTTYTVTCTSNGVPTVLTSTITVFPSAVVTAEVAASADGQVHATLNQSSFTVGCGSSDNITLVVTPETNYRVSRVTLNGAQIYGDEFGEGTVSISVNPGGTLGAIKVFLSNEYQISILELLDTGDTLHLSNLVQPYGNNGLFTATAGNDQTFAFNNTARYVLQDAEIDGVSQGAVTSYDFTNIHESHSIVVTYVDSCGIFVLPFFEDFESVSSGIPECYEKNTGNSSYPTVNNYYPYQGNSIYVYNYSYGESANEVPCLILPKIDEQFDISELMVQFYGRASTDAGLFVIGVMTDPADMSTFTTVQAVSPTNTSGAYEHYTAYLGSYQGTGQYIAIKFPVTAYCLLGIDNLTVDYAPMCSPITNLATTDVYGSNATLTWDPTTVGEVSEYNIVITDNITGSEDFQTTTETTYLLTGLNEMTSYTVGVYTSCTNGDSSDTLSVTFMTPCNNPVNYSVGNATTTNSYLPTHIYYGNSYTQQIVTADVFEGTPNDFASLSVKDNSTSLTSRACDVYLAHVPASMDLSGGWILPDPTNDITFSLVFSGNVQFGTNDWVKIDFDTVFPYNGTDNVLVVFSDHTNSYTSTHQYDVVSNSNTTSMARYAYRDSSPYDAFNPGVSGTALSVVNTFRFSYCSESSCISPNTLSATNLTENSADIAWVSAGSESSWEVEYKAADDADWTSAGTVSATSTTLFNLDGNTLYTVRVRALCSGNEESPWSESISFRTECASITQLPYSEDFEDATELYNSGAQETYILCWDRYASNSSHYVYIPSNSYAHSGTHFLDFHHTSGCFNIAILPAVDASINVSDLMVSFYACRSGNTGYLEVGVMTDKTDPTTFVVMDTIDLSSYNTYEYGLQQVSFENYTDNGQYVAFRVSNGVSCGFYVDDVLIEERPNCMYPTNLHASNVSSDAITLAWTETGTATQWNILYDVTGFDPETEGITVSADANPYTVTGLQNATSYDFYVQADCGGVTSPWTGPVTVKTGVYNMGITGSDTMTTCGMYIYDDGGANGNHSTSCDYTLVIYPETAGSGLSLSGSVNLYNGSSYYQGMLTIYEGVGTSGNVLGSFTGTQTVNIAYGGPVTMRLTTGSYYNYAGFEILVQCTECFPPSNLAVSGQALDGATVSWSGNADSYAIYLSGAMDGYYTTSDTSYTFTGLNGSSSYNVQVRALCGGDSSLLSSTVHFNTACAPITITADNPWIENFDSYAGSGAQSFVCWETPITESVDNGTSPFVYCGHAPSCHSGANSAELKGTSNMVALPEFSNDIQDLRLSFWATTTNTSNYGTVEIGYITDINDPTTFVALGPAGTPGPRGSGSSSGNGNYMGPFDFNGVTATSARMAIKFTGYSGLSWNLDDFTVSLAPNCPSPVKTSVQASNVDGHNATITFTDNDPDHNSWTVYYKPSSDSVWNTTVTNTTSVDLNNLDPETQYDVYVVTNCTTPDMEEDATLTIHFTTTVACPAPTNVTVSDIDLTSAIVSWDGTADSYTVTCGDFTTTATGNTTTITGLTSATTYTVSVVADCGVDGTSSAATFTFSTTICALADQCTYTFVLTDDYGDGWNGGSLSVQQNGIEVASLAAPSHGGGNVMSVDTVTVNLCDNMSTSLVWTAGSWASEASFTLIGPNDSILFSQDGMDSYSTFTFTTDCGGSGPGPVITDPTVTTGQASAITQNTATLSATITNPDNVTITAKGFEWKTTTGGTYTQIAGTGTGNSFTANLSNLTANTGYTFKAFITFDGTTVYGSEVTFTTLPEDTPEPCDVPTGLDTTNVANEVISITWDANANVVNWNVRYRPQNGQWTSATANTNGYTITGLTGSTTYEIQVQANCGDGNASDWSASLFVTTKNVGINSWLENSVNLYPNPAKEYVDIRIDGDVNVTSMEVYDVYGKLLNAMNVVENPTRINVSNLANGMYFVRVNTEAGAVTKTFVKR